MTAQDDRLPPARWRRWNPVTGCTKVSDRLPALLRAALRRALARHLRTSLRARLRPAAPSGASRAAAALEAAATRLRRLDERPLPRGHPRRLRARGVRGHGTGAAARLPRPDQAARAHARRCAASLPWPPNVWMGVTVESGRYAARADALRRVPTAIRHVSAEPLLGPLDALDLTGIHLVIAGGESGPGAGRHSQIGCAACATAASPPASPSRSRAGAARARRPAAACSTAGSGTSRRSCRPNTAQPRRRSSRTRMRRPRTARGALRTLRAPSLPWG